MLINKQTKKKKKKLNELFKIKPVVPIFLWIVKNADIYVPLTTSQKKGPAEVNDPIFEKVKD